MLTRVLFELEALAARAGATVRTEPFSGKLLRGRGGLCWLRGRPVIVMDASLPLTDRIGVLIEALAKLDLGAVGVSLPLAARIESARRRVGRTRSPNPRSRPGLARTRPPRTW